MPRKVVEKETFMQNVRRQYGLKTGTYIQYPSADIRPNFIIKKSRIYDNAGNMHEKGLQITGQLDAYIAKVKELTEKKGA